MARVKLVSQGLALGLHCLSLRGATTSRADLQTDFIYVNVSETWKNAQSYCRVKHTDLASVRNQSENEQLKMMLINSPTWIGLYRNSWMWSDGSAYSFPNWAPNKPLSDDNYSCGTIFLEKWHNSACNGYNYFLCYTGELSFVLATI
uniref:C-type lectin domain-containing protein n=1 Tax=Neolamprologus brichardi TaxID=32507 RepID=A0A3Q4GUF8_NEOBR